MNKTKFKTNVITEIAIFASIALALDFLQAGLFRGVFVNGGSIGLSMIPVILIGFRRGFLPAFITGLIVSLLQMLGGIYVISSTWYNTILQISLDYLLTFPILACCTIFKKPFDSTLNLKHKILFVSLGTMIAGFGKFLLHFLAGIIFWQNFDFPGGYVIYSLVYNGGYMLPNIILSIIIMIILCVKAPMFFKTRGDETNEE